jgi:ABC-type transporter Mla subunit MlaD
MQLNPPAQEGVMRRRLRGLLVWSGLTLLAALALALAMVIASLALELGSGPAPPPPTSPIQFSPAGGHPTPQ